MKFKRSAYENTFNVASQYRKLIEIMRIYTKSFFFLPEHAFYLRL